MAWNSEYFFNTSFRRYVWNCTLSGCVDIEKTVRGDILHNNHLIYNYWSNKWLIICVIILYLTPEVFQSKSSSITIPSRSRANIILTHTINNCLFFSVYQFFYDFHFSHLPCTDIQIYYSDYRFPTNFIMINKKTLNIQFIAKL